MNGTVTAVSSSEGHTGIKPSQDSIQIVEGLGVEGDAHQGETVKHRSLVAKDPTQPNLRQVHLIHAELHDELAEDGLAVLPGQMGENITTRGIDLLNLPRGTKLYLGESAVVSVTGLRNPCAQLDKVQPGLFKACLGEDADGNVILKTGVMSVALAGGEVHPDDPIRVELPAEPHTPLAAV